MKTSAKLLLCLLLAAGSILPAQARKKPTYEITLKINGNDDSVMFMGHYFARGNAVIDTARRDEKGRFRFAGEKDTLKPGLYFFANPAGAYVEFVVYHEKPFFSFETDQKDWTQNMKVKGSEQNSFFYEFHRADAKIEKQLNEQQTRLDSVAFVPVRRTLLMELDSIKRDAMANHPEMFLSKMFKTTLEVYPPMVDEKGDSLSFDQRNEYYLDHFFDNIPLEDNAIIYSPKAVFADRVMNFYDRTLRYATPEAIFHYMDPMLERSKPAPDVFHYLVVMLTQKYLQSNVMVHDEVYVHLVKKYFASDDNFWSEPSAIERELARATKWERLLVGHEAPDMILYDTLRVPHQLHGMPTKWKLLVFWSPTCGHCKHIIPEVYKIYMKYREQYDLGVFAILSEPDDKNRVEWKKFLRDNHIDSPTWLNLDGGEASIDWHEVYDIQSTPQIYLLNEKNIIEAKKLSSSNLEDVLKAVCGER